jgi:hypothetical protein
MGFTVSPGNAIFASVYYSTSSKQYTYYVHNIDTGQKLRVTQSCASGCSISSAQVTASDQNGDLYARFGEVQFMAIKVTDTAGKGGGLVNSNWNTVGQYDGVSPDQSPPDLGPLYSATSPAQSAFQVYYSKPS